MSPFRAIVVFCLVAQMSLTTLAAPVNNNVEARGAITLFPLLKQAVAPSSSTTSNSTSSSVVANKSSSYLNASDNSTSTSTLSFCDRWSSQCTSTCASIDTSAVASTSCRVQGQVMRRAASVSKGALSCKCGTQTITSQVIAKVYKPMNASSTSTTAAATSTSSAQTLQVLVAASTLPIVSHAELWLGHNFVPLSDALPSSSNAAATTTTTPQYTGTWTPAVATVSA